MKFSPFYGAFGTPCFADFLLAYALIPKPGLFLSLVWVVANARVKRCEIYIPCSITITMGLQPFGIQTLSSKFYEKFNFSFEGGDVLN